MPEKGTVVMDSWQVNPPSVSVICVGSGEGAADRRCAEGPAVIMRSGLRRWAASRACRGTEQWIDPVPGDGDDARSRVAAVCARLSTATRDAVRAGRVPLVLAGDHSCAVGTWSGVASALAEGERLGLIWVDAHMDAHVSETTPSGNLHGMPVAALLGHGSEWSSVPGTCGGVLASGGICLIGVRSFEADEAALLAAEGVRIVDMDEVRGVGLERALLAAWTALRGSCDRIGVTIDLDAIDPRDAPGVGTPVPGGLAGRHLAKALASLPRDGALIGLEIAEYNPFMDGDRRTALLTIELVRSVFGGPSMNTPMSLERRYCAGNYHPIPVTLVRGRGVHVWDEQGKRYLDMMSAYSAVSHGHCHPRLVRALKRQADTLGVVSRAFFGEHLGALARRACELTGMDRALPMNTGAEAVETAIKAARKWAYQVKGVPGGQAEIIACEGNFHGRTIAIVGLSCEAQYREGFGPFPAGLSTIPYADTAALEAAITDHTAAFLVEPIQGEGGIIVPPEGYLAQCARICREHNVLLICDEVQTGLGRTGKLLACEHDRVVPDGLVLGKALGGGLLPVSLFLAREDVMEVFRPGDHGSTFGGNPLACAVALEALDVLLEEGLVERSARLGDDMLEQLRSLPGHLIRDVRGRGLFAGIEIDPRYATAREVCERLLAVGVLSKETHDSVVRFAPPLVISREQIAWAVGRLRHVLLAIEHRHRAA